MIDSGDAVLFNGYRYITTFLSGHSIMMSLVYSGTPAGRQLRRMPRRLRVASVRASRTSSGLRPAAAFSGRVAGLVGDLLGAMPHQFSAILAARLRAMEMAPLSGGAAAIRAVCPPEAPYRRF